MILRRFDRILDDCLLRMDRGESLIDILAVYPANAVQLKPLLLVAMLSRALPQPVPGYTALRVGKNQMLAEMASMQAEDSFIKPKPTQPPRDRIVDRWIGALKRLQPAYRFAMLSLVVILAGGFFTFSASASGLADNIMQTLFLSFEQVGEWFWLRPDLDKSMSEGNLFSTDYPLPDSPGNYYGDFKNYLFSESDKGNEGAYLSGNEDQGNQEESGKEDQTNQQGENAGNDQDNNSDGVKDNDNNKDGEKDNDNNKDGDKDNDNNSDGDKDNDNNSDGDKDNDNNSDGDKDNDNNSDGDKDNDNNSDGEKKDKKDNKDK